MSGKIICIGGGVGPMAGVKLQEQIIKNTKTNGTDQDHLEVHHFSRSHDIVDRTQFLLNKIDENPAEGMFRTAQAMDQAAKAIGKTPVLGIPCNTFHAPKIFNHFLELLEKNKIDIQVISMLEETTTFIKKNFAHSKKIGVLTTTGTRTVKVYNQAFEILEVPSEMQEELHDSIYNEEWGVKAKNPVTDKARKKILKFAHILIEQGADIIYIRMYGIPIGVTRKRARWHSIDRPNVYPSKSINP